MTLVNKILTILNSMLPPENPIEGQEYIQTIIYDSAWSANVRVDRKSSPIALVYLLSDWTLNTNSLVYKEAANIQIFFADRANFDSKGEDKDAIVQRMEAIAKEFLSLVISDREIKLLDDNVKIQSSYGRFDSFMVGVTLNLRIEERQSSCL